jgi:hypothetical protein
MGETYKVSCKCGYTKELNTGSGLALCNINMVNKLFAEEKRQVFNTFVNREEVQSFNIENELSLCSKCKEIITVCVLKFQLTNNRKYEIINNCPICRNKVKIINDLTICPKCGQKMFKGKIGHWD